MSAGHWLWEGDRGRIGVRQLGPRFATVELIGRADDSCLPTMTEALDTLLPIEGIAMFWDASRLDSFSNAFRSLCADRIFQYRKTIGAIMALSSSALIAMAVSTTNLALGGIISSYRDPDKFYAARRELALEHGLDLDKLAG